jgi:hypothetical protein
MTKISVYRRRVMNTTPIKRAVAAIGLTCLLSGGMVLTAVTPASAFPDPGPPTTAARSTQTVERRIEVPVPIDDNAVEPSQIALGALGGAALAGAAVVVVGNTTRRTRRLA